MKTIQYTFVLLLMLYICYTQKSGEIDNLNSPFPTSSDFYSLLVSVISKISYKYITTAFTPNQYDNGYWYCRACRQKQYEIPYAYCTSSCVSQLKCYLPVAHCVTQDYNAHTNQYHSRILHTTTIKYNINFSVTRILIKWGDHKS